MGTAQQWGYPELHNPTTLTAVAISSHLHSDVLSTLLSSCLATKMINTFLYYPIQATPFFHTILDIIFTTALVPYQGKERMYVYKHTHTYTTTVTMEVYHMHSNVKSRCPQVQGNTAQVNTMFHVHNQLLYDYFNSKTKTTVGDVQLCQETKTHTFQ